MGRKKNFTSLLNPESFAKLSLEDKIAFVELDDVDIPDLIDIKFNQLDKKGNAWFTGIYPNNRYLSNNLYARYISEKCRQYLLPKEDQKMENENPTTSTSGEESQNQIAIKQSFSEKLYDRIDYVTSVRTSDIEVIEGDNHVSLKKRYQLAVPIPDRDSIVVSSQEDLLTFETITQLTSMGKRASIEIARNFKEIKDKKLNQKYNFSTPARMIRAFFGYAESTANLYIQVAEAFINPDTCTAYYPFDEEWEIAGLLELLPIVNGKNDLCGLANLTKYCVDGYITPYMKQTKLRAIAKSIKEGTLPWIEAKADELESEVVEGTENEPAGDSSDSVSGNVPDDSNVSSDNENTENVGETVSGDTSAESDSADDSGESGESGELVEPDGDYYEDSETITKEEMDEVLERQNKASLTAIRTSVISSIGEEYRRLVSDDEYQEFSKALEVITKAIMVLAQ